MNHFNEIEALWKKSGASPLPGITEIMSKAEKNKKQVSRKIRIQILCMLLVISALVYVAFSFRFQYGSSYAGMILMALCVLVFTRFRLQQYLFLKQIDFSDDPHELLKTFKKFYARQQWLHTVGSFWYVLILNIAFALYFYEVVYLAPSTTQVKIAILVVYIAWMLVATLWIQKRAHKKEHRKTELIIEQLQQLQQSLDA